MDSTHTHTPTNHKCMHGRAYDIRYDIRSKIQRKTNEYINNRLVWTQRERNRWESLEEMPRKRGCPEREDGWVESAGGYAGGIYIPQYQKKPQREQKTSLQTFIQLDTLRVLHQFEAFVLKESLCQTKREYIMLSGWRWRDYVCTMKMKRPERNRRVYTQCVSVGRSKCLCACG